MAKKEKTELTQQFSITAPAALRVQLVGDFTHWQKEPISLQKDSDGVWRTRVSLEPGQYRYRFIVDGQWRDDPECQLRVPSPYGSEDMVRDVPQG